MSRRERLLRILENLGEAAVRRELARLVRPDRLAAPDLLAKLRQSTATLEAFAGRTSLVQWENRGRYNSRQYACREPRRHRQGRGPVMNARALLRKLDDAALAICLGLTGGVIYILAALWERFQ